MSFIRRFHIVLCVVFFLIFVSVVLVVFTVVYTVVPYVVMLPSGIRQLVNKSVKVCSLVES